MNSPMPTPQQNTASAVSAYDYIKIEEFVPHGLVQDCVRAALKKNNPKKALKTLRAGLEKCALELFPDLDHSVARAILDADFERAAKHAQSLKTLRDQEAPVTLEYEYVPFKRLHFMDKLFGCLGLFAILIALSVIPIISAATLTESSKVGILSDVPTLAALFGVTGLSGIFGAAYYRSTLKSDEERNGYDKFITKAAMALMVLWVSTLALSNYPITFGEAALIDNGDWDIAPDDETDKTGFTLSIPIAVTFIVTAALELASGAVFHTIAEVKLAQKRIIKAINNRGVEHLNRETIPQADVEFEAAQAKIEAFDEAAMRPRLMRQKFVSLGIQHFQQKFATARAARDAAIDRALNELSANKSKNHPRNDRSDPTDATRH